jgi:hypothetical protein
MNENKERTEIALTEHLFIFEDDPYKVMYRGRDGKAYWLKFISNAAASELLTPEERDMLKQHRSLMNAIDSNPEELYNEEKVKEELGKIFPKYAEIFPVIPAKESPPNENSIPKSREEAEARKAKGEEKPRSEVTGTIAQRDQEGQEITAEPLDWSAIRNSPEQYVRRLNYLYLHLLQKGTDYGIIPGTQKPTLYKAGAELLAMNLGLTTKTEETTEMGEKFGMPMIICNAHTEVFWDGKKIGDGYGLCSSAETKYAFRWISENKLPKNINKDALYSEEGQTGRRYRVPSSLNEIMDVANTIKKMGIKRAFVDGVLRATGASRIFTQDVEDMGAVVN